MDERYYELIDKYLRKEMSAEETLNFEQEALNDYNLRKEIELTYRIKRRLIDRQNKLYKTSHWERKKKYKIAGFTTITSIAAALAIGFMLINPMQKPEADTTLIASTTVNTKENINEISHEAIVTIKKNISEGKEEVAIAEVTRLEEQNLIPTIKDISEGKFLMAHPKRIEESHTLNDDVYELHWLKIKSLICIGKNEEALELLKSFVKVEGKYKNAADSLMIEMNKHSYFQ